MIAEKRPSITVDDQRASHLFDSICPILAHHTHRKRTPMQLLYRNLSNSVLTIKKKEVHPHTQERKGEGERAMVSGTFRTKYRYKEWNSKQGNGGRGFLFLFPSSILPLKVPQTMAFFLS
jgi:hypothetical protein